MTGQRINASTYYVRIGLLLAERLLLTMSVRDGAGVISFEGTRSSRDVGDDGTKGLFCLRFKVNEVEN